MSQSVNELEALGSIDRLVEWIARNPKVKKVAFVTGKTSFTNIGGARLIEEARSRFQVLTLTDFSPNPKIEDVTKLDLELKQFEPEMMVAVGGGSVLDMGKLLKGVLKEEQADIIDVVRGNKPVSDSGVPLYAVPTTAGSGSEATHFAVCYEGQDKYSVASEFLQPNGFILDGRVLERAPSDIRRASALDAFAQAIESFWAVGATSSSQKSSADALKIIEANILEYCHGSVDLDVLQNMLQGSNLAGSAINISKTTSAHAWSYGITSRFNIPHGDAVWMTLPKIFQIHETVAQQNHPALRQSMEILRDLIKIPKNMDSYEFFQQFLNQLGLETRFDKIGMGDREVRKMLSVSVNMQRMANNPVSFAAEHIDQIFDL